MIGPKNTPYEDGLFTILIIEIILWVNKFHAFISSITYYFSIFPSDYPNHGPEFRFKNKIYHLRVDPKNGRICIGSINS